MPIRDLTVKQRAFIDHYLATLNATESAIKAGYSPKHASEKGYYLVHLNTVSNEIRKRMEARSKRLQITSDRVLEELARIALSDIRNALSYDSNGVKIVPSQELSEEISSTVRSVEERTTFSKRGESHTSVKLEFHDKMKAIDMVGRHLGMWKALDNDDEFKKMTVEQLLNIINTKKIK